MCVRANLRVDKQSEARHKLLPMADNDDDNEKRLARVAPQLHDAYEVSCRTNTANTMACTMAHILKYATRYAMVFLLQWVDDPDSLPVSAHDDPKEQVASISVDLCMAEQMLRNHANVVGDTNSTALGPLVITAAALAPIFMLCQSMTLALKREIAGSLMRESFKDYERAAWVIEHEGAIAGLGEIVARVRPKILSTMAFFKSEGFLADSDDEPVTCDGTVGPA